MKAKSKAVRDMGEGGEGLRKLNETLLGETVASGHSVLNTSSNSESKIEWKV
jgi:hypothetical protein